MAAGTLIQVPNVGLIAGGSALSFFDRPLLTELGLLPSSSEAVAQIERARQTVVEPWADGFDWLGQQLGLRSPTARPPDAPSVETALNPPSGGPVEVDVTVPPDPNASSLDQAMADVEALAASIGEFPTFLKSDHSAGYSLLMHTGMVLNRFRRYFPGPLPGNLPRHAMETTILLHDIRKGVAREAAMSGADPNADQHHYTLRHMEEIRDRLPLNDAEYQVARALIQYSCLGELLMGKIGVDQALGMVLDGAREAGIPVQDFFQLSVIYYQSDSGAYTADAGGRPLLDALYVQESDGSHARAEDPFRLLFAPREEATYQQLLARVRAFDGE
jgi:hypothetical protein